MKIRSDGFVYVLTVLNIDAAKIPFFEVAELVSHHNKGISLRIIPNIFKEGISITVSAKHSANCQSSFVCFEGIIRQARGRLLSPSPMAAGISPLSMCVIDGSAVLYLVASSR